MKPLISFSEDTEPVEHWEIGEVMWKLIFPTWLDLPSLLLFTSFRYLGIWRERKKNKGSAHWEEWQGLFRRCQKKRNAISCLVSFLLFLFSLLSSFAFFSTLILLFSYPPFFSSVYLPPFPPFFPTTTNLLANLTVYLSSN